MGDLGENIERERKLRKRWARIERKRARSVKEIRRGIHEINESLERLRKLRKELREEDRDAKAEQIVDRIENLEDVKDDLLEEIDEERKDHAEAVKILDEHRDRVQALRKKREARRKSREGKGDLSEHFSIGEFACRDGTPVPAYMKPSLAALCRDHLEPARAKFGPIRITSGYRTRAYNARIGGASQSYHIYDLRRRAPAADHVATASPGQLQTFYDAKPNPPDGMGYYGSFTHIDDRGYRSRWYGAG